MIRKKSTLFAIFTIFSFIFLFFFMIDSGAQVTKAVNKVAPKKIAIPSGAKNALLRFDKAPGPASKVGNGDADVGSKDGHQTYWELEVRLEPTSKDTSGKYRGIIAHYTYTVKEDKKDYTHLVQTGKVNLPVNFAFSKLEGQIDQTVSGNVQGKQHNLVNAEVPTNCLINNLSVKIDSNKGDDRSEINFTGHLKVYYSE